MSGDDFLSHKTEINLIYDECLQAQLEHHKSNKRLQRLKIMLLDYEGVIRNIEKLKKESNKWCKLDRWTVYINFLKNFIS